MPAESVFTEASARDVLLLRAFETAADPALWTVEDRQWATKLARTAPARTFIAERARHAMQRLTPREPRLARLRSVAPWHGAWSAPAFAIGLLAGALVDHIGSAQRINLLAPPVWALVSWNIGLALLFCLAWLKRRLRAAPSRPGWVQRWLASRVAGRAPSGPLRVFAADWLHAAAPLHRARAGLLLHLAAAGLAIGVAGGMYARGLVLDYRAGWQSTFLDAAAVQAVLDAALWPASRASGIAVPAVAPLRVAPHEGAPGPAVALPAVDAGAAPWLHLYAVTLGLVVVGPRLLLAAGAAWRAVRGKRRIELPLHEAYFQQLAALRADRAPTIVVQPVGYTPAPAMVLSLREYLVREWGDRTTIDWRDAVPPNADDASPPTPLPAATAHVAVFDLATTPEAEVQGRWLRERAAAWPSLAIVVDASGFVQRFAAMPERVAQRRRLWQDFAAALALRCDVVGA